MANELTSLRQASGAIEQARLSREEAISAAFVTLVKFKPLIAASLIEHLGGKTHASRWMCAHHRAFDGKNAYDLLADGAEDIVWDEMARLPK